MKRQEKIELLKKTVFEMFPNAKTELEYNNEFQLLISILMSAQATDKQVNIINRNFFQYLKTPEDGLNL
jgi:endonuclease-3